jgi:large subunit ribosomal protein L16
MVVFSINQGLLKFKYGSFFIKFLEMGFLNSLQLNSLAMFLKRYFKKTGSYHFFVYPNLVFTKKSVGSRMGRGKGSPLFLVKMIKPGFIFLELYGISYYLAKKILHELESKLQIRCELNYFVRN